MIVYYFRALEGSAPPRLVREESIGSSGSIPEARPGGCGLSMFLVDTTLPGVKVQRLDALGRHTTEANHCFFEDVRQSKKKGGEK